jgi:glycine/D-amino acid oxidase-like deaminating enzyme
VSGGGSATNAGVDRRVGVIGGGVLGVSTAAHLARLGARVTLITDGALGSGASGRSLSWLNSFGARTQAYHRLRLEGIQRYRRFREDRGASDYIRFDGGLNWTSPENVDQQREAFEWMTRAGYPARWLAPDEVTQFTPGVNRDALPDHGVIFNPTEGWVELPPLIATLAREVVDHGGEIVTHAAQATIAVTDGRVDSVITASGQTFEVDAAVLATGADVPRTLADLGVQVPDATPTALLVRTRRIDAPLRAVLNTPRVAVRPTPEGSLVLDSDWSEREVTDRQDGTYEVKPETVEGLLREASAVLAGRPALPFESYGVGPKPIPGDGEPVLGELDAVTGYFVAFTHSGATLGLIAGELLAAEIVHGSRHPLLQPFRPTRFAAGMAGRVPSIDAPAGAG